MASHSQTGAPSSDQPAPTRILNAPLGLDRGVVLSNRYVVERVLGQGGMGVVVAAEDRTTGRRVALKFLQLEASRDPEVHARFLREAQAASSIACEHVVRVFDAGTMGSGAPYIVMELLEGEDLSQAVERRGALPVQEVVDHVLEALVAVGLAHLRGIVHRDLKPANLFLTHHVDGRPLVKVLDFGLSKDVAGREELNLTKTSHAAIGTPLYMAPEQIRSLKSASFASDLWAMGVILFELATGQLPFDGESLGALFSAIAADPARRLDDVLPGAPPQLVEAIERCLRKKPADRPADALTLAGLLVPLATPRGRAAYARLQREHANTTGGWNLAGGEIVDEPSGTRAPGPVERARPAPTFAMTRGMPIADPSTTMGMAAPAAPPRPAGPGSTGRGALLAGVLLAAAGVGAGAWWLMVRGLGETASTPTVAGPDQAGTQAGTTAAPSNVAPVELGPRAETVAAPPSTDPAPGETAASSAAPAASPAAFPAAGGTKPWAPRPPGTATPAAPTAEPAAPSTSLEDVMKKGRR